MRAGFLRRRWLPAIVAAVASIGLAACSSGTGSGPTGGGTLHVYVYQDASTKVQDAAVAAFNKTSSVKVVLDRIPGDSYPAKLRTAMGSPNAPDILFNWGGGSIKPYVDNGLLLDLTPTFNSDPTFKSAFIPSVLDAGKLSGRYYGVPMRGMQPVILFYDKTLFARYGLVPPKTWDDLVKAVGVFKAKGVTPFALGGQDAWTEQMWLEYLVDRYGGPQVFARIESGDQSGWGDPAVLKAAQTVKQLVGAGAFGRNYNSVGYVDTAASTLFAQGKTAMHLMGSWEYANQLANHPSFAQQNLGYTTFPSVPGGVGSLADVVGNPTNYFSINAHTKYKSAAIAFVKTMADPSYANLLINNGDVPTTSNAQSLLGKSPSPAYAAFQYQLAQNAPNFTLSWDQALVSTIATPMLTTIQKLFLGQLSPEQFVAAAKSLQ